jgi:erythromycin esterase
MVNVNQETDVIHAIQQVARPLDTLEDLDPLMDRIGDARFVLLGEATHGTSEFYRWRARLSRRLIEEKGFSFIAVEGDWPDCYQVNRYVKGYDGSGKTARDVLHGFSRWPTWMWANWEVVMLAEWMREHNDRLPNEQKVGFYGLDVYSLWDSLTEVTKYLEDTDPEAAKAAREAYQCFQPYNRDEQAYAWATRVVPESCERDVVELLQKTRDVAMAQTYPGDGEAAFSAEQNALVAVGAERYYRAMIQGGPESWNIRDGHMMETLERLVNHFGPESKAIVWEHNTHIGDARATDMAGAGMYNVGQLARERRGGEGVVLVGCGTHHGTVIAGREWDAPMEVMRVPEGRESSWEDMFHRAMIGDGLIIMSEIDEAASDIFRKTRAHRAIGVVYNPNYERMGNYVPTSMSRRYDAFMFVDETEALHPLHMPTEQPTSEPPETYPWAV